MKPKLVFCVDSKIPAALIADDLYQLLSADNKVLWLVSGGSCIDVAIKVMSTLEKLSLGGSHKSTGELHIGLIDERFGEPGHQDSNWQQLLDKGFDAGSSTIKITAHPVLNTVVADTSLEATAKNYNQCLLDLIQRVDTVIGLFGMGADGHTAGLLPGNPIMQSPLLVDHYIAADYSRITVTPKLVDKLGKARLFAIGSHKWPNLDRLLVGRDSVSLADTIPVAILYSAKDFVVYSDLRQDS